MKKVDVVTLRHPGLEKQDLREVNSYAVVVSMDKCEENLRVAQELFIKRQLENFRLL